MLAPTIFPPKSQMYDFYEHLQESRLFTCLSGEQIEEITKASMVRQLPDRAPLSLPTDESQTVHFLMSGRARVCYLTRDAKQPILYFVNTHELVGEQSIFNGVAGEEYVETMEPTVVASIPTRQLRHLLLSEPTFATGISELISRRRTKVERRIRHLLFLSNRERLSHLLLDLAEQYGSWSSDRLDLQVKLSHQDLANFIGSTRETVTVVLGKMQLDGLVTVKRRRIALLDAETLARSVDRPFLTSRTRD